MLDALTAFDELLLAGFALAAARPRGARRAPAIASRCSACVAISLSFIALAMGCEPSPRRRPASGRLRAPGASLICHLY